MNVTLYTTHCPRCTVLKSKLDNKGIGYEVVDNIETLQEKGITEAPMLEVDGELKGFMDAIRWVNTVEV